MAGPSRSIAGGSLHLTTYEQRQQMITRIHFIFGLFAAFAIFDFCSDVYMLAAIQSDLSDYEQYIDQELNINPMLTGGQGGCACNAGEQCWTTSTDACDVAGLCKSYTEYSELATVAGGDTSRTCNVDSYVDSAVNTNVCSFKEDMQSLTKELRDLWLAYLVFVIISVFITIVYFWQLWKKWKSKLHTVPLAAPRRGGVKATGGNARPYFAPPEEEWPGKPAAPTYVDKFSSKSRRKSKKGSTAAVQQEFEDRVQQAEEHACEGCDDRDAKGEIYCRDCGRARGSVINTRLAQGKARRKLDEDEQTRRKAVEGYILTFMYVAGVRIIALLIEDIPQAIMVVYYVVLIDKPDGLACMECSAGGGACEFGRSFNQTAVWLLVAGQFCSILLLMFQVMFIRSVSEREQLDATFCGTDVLIALISLPAAACPVIITILVTPAKEILDMSDTAEIVCIVVVCLFMLPWVAGLGLFCAICSESTGLDDAACCCCDGCDGCGDCCGDCAEMLCCCC